MMNIIFNNSIALFFVGMIVLGIFMVVVSVLFKKNLSKKNNKSSQSLDRKKDIVLNDTDDVKEKIFQLYKDFEIAKMKFRYTVLEDVLVKELYQKYEKKLNEMKEKNQKQVSTDITLEEIRILLRDVKGENEKIEVFLHVSQYDYVINKDKSVVRGTDEAKYQIEYNMTVNRNIKTNKYVIFKKECKGKWIKK